MSGKKPCCNFDANRRGTGNNGAQQRQQRDKAQRPAGQTRKVTNWKRAY